MVFLPEAGLSRYRKAVFACDTEIKRKVLTNNHLDFIKKCVLDVIGYSPEIEIKVDPSVKLRSNPYSHNLFMEQLQSRADSSTDSSDEEEPGEVDYNEDGDDVSYTPYTPMPESESGSSWSRPEPLPKAAESEKSQKKDYADSDHFASDPDDAAKGERWRNYIKDYTFENFIVGSSNQLAHASAMNVADHIGTMVNPLFIWGPSGLGKTHLMYAIANRALEHNPGMKIICIKGEEFTNQASSTQFRKTATASSGRSSAAAICS